jgi:glycosyltransferase involved in cell wall biosynthesis
VRRQVKTVAPDLIHANSIRAGLVMTVATLGLRVPVIWHLHDLLPHHPLSTAIRLFALSSSRLRLLAVSQATARRFHGVLLRPFARRVPVTTIHNCADTDKFQPDKELRQTTRAALGLHETTFVIGLVGQITERKGQLGLLRAFAKVVQELPDAVLLLAGEPLFTAADQQYHERLQQAASELGIAAQVRFLGARRDVPALLQAMDVLVVNSLAEPCGLVVLEGMASGLPVVVTAVGGNAELVHHSFSGWWVPVADDPTLAETLLMMQQLPTLRERLAQNARLRVQQFFTVEIYMKAVQAFYLTARDSESSRRSVRQPSVPRPLKEL